MLGAVNWETGGNKKKNIASLLNGRDETDARRVLTQSSHLQGHDAGVGAVLIDLIHGSLQSYSLLGEILQVLGALLGFLMSLTHLRR